MSRPAGRVKSLERKLRGLAGDGVDHSRCPRLMFLGQGANGATHTLAAFDLWGRLTDRPLCPVCVASMTLGLAPDDI
jgi:hypothetical protein